MILRLPSEQARRLERHALEAYPAECCGALLGRAAAGVARVDEVVELPNVAEEAERSYRVDSRRLLELHRSSREGGHQVLGYYHSHPTGDARPSETDRRDAWPELSYLIAGVDGSRVSATRSWRLVAGRFVEESVEIVGAE